MGSTRDGTGSGKAGDVAGGGGREERQGSEAESPAKEAELRLADPWMALMGLEPGCDMSIAVLYSQIRSLGGAAGAQH